jgi:hypothetical protein
LEVHRASRQHQPGHVNLINLAGESDEIVDKFEKLSDIESALKPVLTDPTVNTIIFDSITSFMDRCLTRGIVRVGSTPRERPTNLAPGSVAMALVPCWFASV